jgi:hypothetical protein
VRGLEDAVVVALGQDDVRLGCPGLDDQVALEGLRADDGRAGLGGADGVQGDERHGGALGFQRGRRGLRPVEQGDTARFASRAHQLAGHLLELEVVLLPCRDEEVGDSGGGGQPGVEHGLAGGDEDVHVTGQCGVEGCTEIRRRGTESLEDVGHLA